MATTAVDRAAGCVGLEALDLGVGDEVEVRVLERGVDADGLRVRLRVENAHEPVHPITTNTAARARRGAVLVLVEHDPDREVRRVQSQLLEIVAQLLDARLVLHRRVRVLGAPRSVGWVSPGGTVHDVQLLRFGVPRFEVRVGERPGR